MMYMISIYPHRGRQLIDDVCDIECKALQYAMSNSKTAGIVCFDLRAAFPSIAREYIFWVLECMGVPVILYMRFVSYIAIMCATSP